MSDTQTMYDIEDFDIRKEQAIALGVSVEEHMTKDCLEKEIVQKLDAGMQDLKLILDEISHLSS